MDRIQKSLLKSVYSKSPVPVYERPMKRFYGRYNGIHIIISKDIQNYQKVAIFFHELGHCLCDQSRCRCQNDPTGIDEEAHAITYGILACFNHEFFNSAYWGIKIVLDTINNPDNYTKMEYSSAIKAIGSTKWKNNLPKIILEAKICPKI